jgi:chorismate dehydratase
LSNSGPSDLRSLRIATLGALNARPLVHGLPGQLIPCQPAQAVEAFARQEVDLALLPVAAVFSRGWQNHIIHSLGIAARGPVYSVFVTWTGEEKNIRRLHLDPASRSSVALLRVLQKQHGILGANRWLETSTPEKDGARLLIGDQAIDFRRQHESTHHFADLAELWQEKTGLPFVFAVWVTQPSLTAHHTEICQALTALCQKNLGQLESFFPPQDDPSFWKEYFGRLHYFLDARDLAGMRLFQQWME